MIACVSYKGGVGKSTTAIHVAAYFSRLGKTVLIDSDLNRSCMQWASQGKLPFPVFDIADQDKAEGKYIVADTAARPTRTELQFLVNNGAVIIIPSTPDVLSLQALRQIITDLAKYPSANFTVLLTIIPAKPNRDGDEAFEYLRKRHVPIFDTGVRRIVALQRAALAGVTVDRIDRENLGWADYERIGRRLQDMVPTRVASTRV